MKSIKKTLKPALLLLSFVLAANAAFCQDPGGNPDGPPPAVPFDDYLYIVLIVLGAVFSLFAIKKLQRARSLK